MFLATIFTQKMPGSSSSMCSSILMLETYDIIILPEVHQTHNKL